MNKAFYALLALSAISYLGVLNAQGLYDRMREDRNYDNNGASNSSRSGYYRSNNDNGMRSSNSFYYSNPYNNPRDQQSSYYYYNTPEATPAGMPRTSQNYYYNWDAPNQR